MCVLGGVAQPESHTANGSSRVCKGNPEDGTRPGPLTVSTRVVSRTILFLMRRTRSRLLVLICSKGRGLVGTYKECSSLPS